MIRVYTGDALATLKKLRSESVQSCVTSPPYWGLRESQVVVELPASIMRAEGAEITFTQGAPDNGTLRLVIEVRHPNLRYGAPK